LALSLDGKCATALKQRAKAYYKIKEFEMAERDVDYALSLNR
jgi:hypothetical protein